jgi:hypothetical protein
VSNDIRNWTAHCLTLNVAAMHSPMLLGPHPSSPPQFPPGMMNHRLGFNIAIFWVRLLVIARSPQHASVRERYGTTGSACAS